MNAIISGQAATAVLLDENALWVVHLDEPKVRRPCRQSDLPHVFADASDVSILQNVNEDDVARALLTSWREDRALRLTLILLDHNANEATRRMAVEPLNELLSSTEAREFTCNVLYSAPLPETADLLCAKGFARSAEALNILPMLAELTSDQSRIRECRHAWDNLATSLFPDSADKAAMEHLAAVNGAFRLMAQPEREGDAVRQDVQSCLGEDLGKAAVVVRSWVAALTATTPVAASLHVSTSTQEKRTFTQAGRVSASRAQRGYVLALETELALDVQQLRWIVGSPSAVVESIERTAQGTNRHYVVVRPGECRPSDLRGLVTAVERRLLLHELRKRVWDIDATPFPNIATRALWQLMAHATAEVREPLIEIRSVWQREVRLMVDQLHRPDAAFWEDRAYERHLDRIIDRRLMLIAWIDRLLDRGTREAKRFGQEHHLL